MDDLIPDDEMDPVLPGINKPRRAQLRHHGGGPVYIKVGRKIFYRRSDIEAWLNANRYERTDKPVSVG